MMRLLSENDWKRIRTDMEDKRADTLYRHDVQTGYRVWAYVDILTGRIAEVRGQDMVLTVSRTFPNGNTSTQNFDSVEDAREMLYGK